MSVVESAIAPDEPKTPETPSEWFDHNVRATFHSIIENMLLRSESEKVVLHALVDDLDKDPSEVIAKLEIAPINQGGGGYVDPVLAQVLADNAALRGDVQKLLDALTSKSDTTEAEKKVEADLAVVEPVSTQVTPPVAPAPIQTAPAPAPTPVETPAPGAETTPAPGAETTPAPATEIAPATTELPPAV